MKTKPAGVVTAVMLPNFAVSTMSPTATSYAGPVPVLFTTMVTLTVSPASAPGTLNVFVTASVGSTTVTSTGGVGVGGTPSPGMSKVAVFGSTVWLPLVPMLPTTSVTRAVTRIRNELFPAMLSAFATIDPKSKLTSSPSLAPPDTLGAGTVPLKSAVSSPLLAAALVTMLELTNCNPAGSESITLSEGAVPAGTVTTSAYVTSSPMATLLPAVAASLVPKNCLPKVAVATVTVRLSTRRRLLRFASP